MRLDDPAINSSIPFKTLLIKSALLNSLNLNPRQILSC